MMLFDFGSLFMNVPFDETIDINLTRICIKKEINTDIPKQEMKKLLIL